MGVNAMIVPRCNASVKSASDTSSVFMEFETVSVSSLLNDVEADVDVIVVLRRFSPIMFTSSEKSAEVKVTIDASTDARDFPSYISH
jgi:hypothetical protein